MKLALAILVALAAPAHADTCKLDALAAGHAVKLPPVGLAEIVHDTSAKSVWTGRYFIVMHGYPPLDAHVYDACTDTWRAAPAWPDDDHWKGTYIRPTWSGSRVILSINTPVGELDPVTLEWHAASDAARAAEWVWFDHSYQHLQIHDGRKLKKHELANPPDGRHNQTEARDGDRVVVWGGQNKDDSERDDGVILDLAHDAWKPISSKHAPSARFGQEAVWVHGKLVVWGGLHRDGKDMKCLTDGAIYDPASDVWTPIDPTNAPAARHAAIEIVQGDLLGVFGGVKCWTADKQLDTGAVLDVAHAKWRTFALPSAIASAGVNAVEGYAIAGGKFLVTTLIGPTFIYDPKTNALRSLPPIIPAKAEWRLRGVTDTTLVLWGKRTEVRPGMPCPPRQDPRMPQCDPMPGVYSESDEGWLYRF